ncbi:MAG: endonuclease/exonuclease/phosphatase family protein [Acholeplasmataceae bacterium]|jgi:endonuclease/exonuclease/phosphatase family metal-dependent hydrolase
MYRFMTFNLRINVSSDGSNSWPYRYHSVSRLIRDQKPLVVGTQEVLLSMQEDLKPQLPDYTFFGVPRKPNEESNTIIYNHHLLDLVTGGTFWLSETPSKPFSSNPDSACVRICTWAEFKLKRPPHQSFRVFNTHLDHISQRARINGISIIFDKIKYHQNLETLPTILMGDFNDTPSSDTLLEINRYDHLAIYPTKTTVPPLKEDSIATYHGFNGPIQGEPIDYIFLTKDIKCLHYAILTDQINGQDPSDHYPVIVDVRF